MGEWDAEPHGLRQRKRERTRRRIEEEALALFETRGFDETTVDDIAAAAEVSRASVFRYFGTKDDIIFAPEAELLGGLEGLMRQRPYLTLDDVVTRYADHIDANFPELRRRGRVIVATPKLVERFAYVRMRWELVVADELARRRGGSATRSFEDRVAATAAMGPLFVAFLTWPLDGGSLSSFVRRGLGIVPHALADEPPARRRT